MEIKTKMIHTAMFGENIRNLLSSIFSNSRSISCCSDRMRIPRSCSFFCILSTHSLKSYPTMISLVNEYSKWNLPTDKTPLRLGDGNLILTAEALHHIFSTTHHIKTLNTYQLIQHSKKLLVFITNLMLFRQAPQPH